MLEKKYIGQKIERKKYLFSRVKKTEEKKGKHFSSTFTLFYPSYLLQYTLVS
jgi:hypothetical protein